MTTPHPPQPASSGPSPTPADPFDDRAATATSGSGAHSSGRLRRFIGGQRGLRLNRLSEPSRTVVAVALAGATLLGVAVLTGARGPSQTLDVLGRTFDYFPLVLPIVVVAAGVASGALSLAAIRAGGVQRLGLSAGVVGLAAFALAQVPPTAPARPLIVAVTVAATAFSLVDLRASGPAWSWSQMGLLALSFAGAAVAVLTANQFQRAFAVLDSLRLIPYATVGLGVVVIVSLTSTLLARHERVEPLLALRRPRGILWAVIGAKVTLLVVLYAGLLGEAVGGRAMWRPRLDQPLSWLHAAAVAGVILAVVAQGAKRPLEARSFGPRLLVLVAAAALGHIAFLIAAGTAVLMQALVPTADVVPLLVVGAQAIDHLELLQLGLSVAMLVLAAGSIVLRRQVTTGLALWLIAGVWLVPPTLGIWLDSVGILGDRTFWAAPGQVEAALTIAVIGLAASRRHRIDDRLLLRLLIVPPVIILGGIVLPEEWTAAQTRLLLVATVLLALTLRAPRLELDPQSYERTVATLVAGNLLLLAAYAVMPTDDLVASLGASGTIALLWLAVPVAGVLVADSRPRALPDRSDLRRPLRQRWARSGS